MALLSSSLRFARDWADCALSLAFPWQESAEAEPVPITRPYCEKCGEPFAHLRGHAREFVCYNCVDRRWSFEWARAGFRTEGQVLEAIVRFKYGDEFYRRAQLTAWLIETYDRYAGTGEWHAVVPVPLYHLRRRERGFNQAREIAKGLEAGRNIPVLDCLYRYRETATQTRLERAERWENMSGAFRLKGGFDVRGRHLLLVDDVFTTGATVNACAQPLRQAGAARVAVLTIGRS